jgi:hypothetical protein
MKRKHYDEGGDVMEAVNASVESQDIANSMGAGPRNEEIPKAKTAATKPRVVSKKELEDSGMSLRDYLNNKRGLTRRKEKNPTPKLIDPSNIRSGPRFDDEGLIDPSNIRSGRRPEEEALLKNRVKGMKSGGSVSSASNRADGCATKGKTKGTMVKMNYGGKC